MVEGFIRLMNAPDEVTGPINIGNPGEYTIKQLAEMIIEITGSPSKLVYEPLPADDPTRRQPDITLAKKELDWEPKIELRDGLQKTIDWFKTIDIDRYRPPTPNF